MCVDQTIFFLFLQLSLFKFSVNLKNEFQNYKPKIYRNFLSHQLDEIIDVVELSIEEAEDMVKQGAKNASPPSCLLGVLWFLINKSPQRPQ